MKRGFGNKVAAAGLSALSMIGPACAAEYSGDPFYQPELEPVTAPEPDFGPQEVEVDEEIVRVIQVRDASVERYENVIWPLPEDYHIASEMLGRATLGAADVRFTTPHVVTLPRNASAELCMLSVAGDEAGWRSALDRVHDEATLLADAQTAGRMKYDATVFDFNDIEVCYPGGTFSEQGYISPVAGDASHNGPVNIYARNASTIVHELSHEWGLGHGDLQICMATDSNTSDPEWEWPDRSTDACYADQYADNSTFMGVHDGGRDGLRGYDLALREILQPEQIIEVTESGTYDLNALLNDTNGPKLLFIPDYEHWMHTQITNGTEGEVGEVDYLFEPDEGFYIELSGTQVDSTITQECLQLSRLDHEQSETCNPADVGIRIMRGADYRNTVNVHPHTIALDLAVSEIGTHAGPDRVGQEIFEHNGIRVELLTLDSDPAQNGTGTAQLRITRPYTFTG